MRSFPKSWFICGGWALDLFLGKQTRAHHDIDIGLFRADQLHLQTHFDTHHLFWIENGEKRPWETGHYLQLPIHELRLDVNDGEMEFVLNEGSATHWIYRRNPAISLPLEQAILSTPEGIPYLAPEIVLLYKSTHLSPKNQQDFDSVINHLSTAQKQWLQGSLRLGGNGHVWLGLGK